MDKKVLLMILDGWGIGKNDKSNAIYSAKTPNMHALAEKYPTAQLLTSGENVGLPHGQMGNSEVGHLNIGAGRIVYQDLVKINRACADNSIMENEEVKKVFSYARDNKKPIHFMGLVSDGGVHSIQEHLYKLCDIAKEYNIEKVYIHAFLDGRDTDPKGGKGYIKQLLEHCSKSTAKVASIIGRYYAMDRDKRWERVKDAYNLIVKGEGETSSNLIASIEKSYENGITDEFVKPIVNVGTDGKPIGTLKEGDAVIFFNYRNDRAREITQMLTQEDMPQYGTKVIPKLYYACMTPYSDKFKGLHVLFNKDKLKETIGEIVSKAGKKQLRIAETEKYPHVTFFFSGGEEKEFDGERRVLIPSPKVPTYDLQPEMSALGIRDALITELNKQDLNFIALNFANGDMVGHTGVYSAIVKAIEVVDSYVKDVVEAAQKNGYSIIIIADHGNADYAINNDGTPNTAHSLNPVPIIVVDEDVKEVENGILADIAPTILHMMGIKQPKSMTGKILVK